MTWLENYLASKYGATPAKEMMQQYDIPGEDILVVTGPEFQFDN